MPKRVLQGKVTSSNQDKTIAVLVERRIKHPLYKKTITKSKKYLAHDPQNVFNQGDFVKIVEHVPISKRKKWHVVYENDK